MNHVTQILSQIESGDPSAAEQLLPLVYDELRKLAAAKMGLENVVKTTVYLKDLGHRIGYTEQ